MILGPYFATMGYWKRHQNKDIEALLREFHEHGWRILDPPTYYQVRCPCGQHKRSIHLTPSGPRYVNNARAWLYRQECERRKEGDRR